MNEEENELQHERNAIEHDDIWQEIAKLQDRLDMLDANREGL